MKTAHAHAALTLRGSRVKNGIETKDGQVPFSPSWGLQRGNPGLLGSTPADGELDKVHVVIATNGAVVLVPCEEDPRRELVLVQQYTTGSGAKRAPNFKVELGEEVRQLSKASTSGGSGGERWVLVSAPIGWAHNIANQFVGEVDWPNQTISFNPEFAGREESDLPRDVFLAFHGDEDRARTFMDNVDALPSELLDGHIIHNCGRKMVKLHLEGISGNPDFFVGADPNRVVAYVDEVHFSGEKEFAQTGSGSLGAFADALRKAGLGS